MYIHIHISYKYIYAPNFTCTHLASDECVRARKMRCIYFCACIPLSESKKQVKGSEIVNSTEESWFSVCMGGWDVVCIDDIANTLKYSDKNALQQGLWDALRGTSPMDRKTSCHFQKSLCIHIKDVCVR